MLYSKELENSMMLHALFYCVYLFFIIFDVTNLMLCICYDHIHVFTCLIDCQLFQLQLYHNIIPIRLRTPIDSCFHQQMCSFKQTQKSGRIIRIPQTNYRNFCAMFGNNCFCRPKTGTFRSVFCIASPILLFYRSLTDNFSCLIRSSHTIHKIKL